MKAFEKDNHVIAHAWVDTVWKDGTFRLDTATFNVPNGDCWHYPLEDHVVEELAKTAHDAFFEGDWSDVSQIERELWRQVVRAVFSRLMDGDPLT